MSEANGRGGGVLDRILLILALASGVAAAAEPIRIAHVYDATGALAEHGRQLQLGMQLGFEYATEGTWQVLGRPLELIGKDSRSRPDQVRSLLAEAYAGDGAVLAVGPLAAAAVLGAVAVAENFRRILIAESAADAVTSSAWNRYVFRVGRSWSQELIANAVVAARPGVCIAAIAQDYAFGRDGLAVYRQAANRRGAVVYREEYGAAGDNSAEGAMRRLLEALVDRGACADKYIFAIWAGGGHPFASLPESAQAYPGIKLTLGGSIALPAELLRRLPAVESAIDYHYRGPANPVNDWLVTQHFRRFNSPPSALVAQGMAQALFIVSALERAGSTDTEALIEAMEGLSFDSPKGRLVMRPEDHQALQPMYHVRLRPSPERTPELELVREIGWQEIELPIRNLP